MSLFEEETSQHPAVEPPGIWAQIKALFTPLGWEEYDAAYDPYVERAGEGGQRHGDDGYNDYSGAGSGWLTDDHDQHQHIDDMHRGAANGETDDIELARRRQQARMDIEDAEDVIESLAILGLICLVAALVALRARWAERERRERIEREARERLMQAAAAQAPLHTQVQEQAQDAPAAMEDRGGEDVLAGWEPPVL